MVDAFFLKFQMDKRKNAFSRGSRQGENRRKRLYFHRTVEMKQPQTITEPKKNSLNGVRSGCFFSLRNDFQEGFDNVENL